MIKIKWIIYLTSFFVINSIALCQSDNIVIGKIDSVYSEVLGESRNIWIYTPDNNDQLFSKKSSPVVYVLDGPAHFTAIVGMLQSLASNGVCPDMIVVGVPNTNRTRDLTPTKGIAPHQYLTPAMVEVSGGGDKFLDFMEDELMPYIESNYSTAPFKTLIGHSFGGLMAAYTFKHRPEMFNAYISIDPSMWWAKQGLLNEYKNSEFDDRHKNKMLFLSIANTFDGSLDAKQALEDHTMDTEHFRKIMELDDYLNDHSQAFKYKGKYYENDDHGSVPFITHYDAFRFFFDFYKLKMTANDFMNPEIDLAGKMRNHYQQVSKFMNYTVLPDEATINGMGYQLMARKQFKNAEEIFKMNTINYPKSYNTYDSLGDLYLELGDKINANKNFKKSISLNPNSPSKDKLSETK